jgi:hypothetical protein
VEYWNHRHKGPVTLDNISDVNKYSFGLSCSIGDTQEKDFGISLTKKNQDNPSEGQGNHSIDEEVLRGLLKKASPEELRIMHRIFCSESQSSQWRVAFTSLIEDIQKSCR